jgi:anti-sigma factor RsiW
MNSAHDSARDRQLEEILHAYLQALDAGQAPDREALLRQHPAFASDLATFFANQDAVARVAHGMTDTATPLSAVAQAVTLVPADTAAAPGKRIRYFGDYELLHEIARGGMGMVYKARPGATTPGLVLAWVTISPFFAQGPRKKYGASTQPAYG